MKLVHFYGYFKINLKNFHSRRLKKIEIFFFINAESMFVNLEVKSTVVKCWTLCSMYGALFMVSTGICDFGGLKMI